jgi:hypothetical protein
VPILSRFALVQPNQQLPHLSVATGSNSAVEPDRDSEIAQRAIAGQNSSFTLSVYDDYCTARALR